MENLKDKKCIPREDGTPPMNRTEIDQHLDMLPSEWEVSDDKILKKSFPFENFKRGMAFAQEIGMVAEKENHHPDLGIHYTNVDVELSTHSIGGLSKNDFIMAAKIEQL